MPAIPAASLSLHSCLVSWQFLVALVLAAWWRVPRIFTGRFCLWTGPHACKTLLSTRACRGYGVARGRQTSASILVKDGQDGTDERRRRIGTAPAFLHTFASCALNAFQSLCWRAGPSIQLHTPAPHPTLLPHLPFHPTYPYTAATGLRTGTLGQWGGLV